MQLVRLEGVHHALLDISVLQQPEVIPLTGLCLLNLLVALTSFIPLNYKFESLSATTLCEKFAIHDDFAPVKVCNYANPTRVEFVHMYERCFQVTRDAVFMSRPIRSLKTGPGDEVDLTCWPTAKTGFILS